MKINLGCGFNKINGFINCDSNKRCNPDRVIDWSKGKLPFKDNEVNEVCANYFFEKIGDKFFDIIKELYRVCKKGALLNIKFIHPRNDLFYSNPKNIRPVSVDLFRHFSKKYGSHFENTDKKSLSIVFDIDVDFEIIDFQYEIELDFQKTLEENNPGQIEFLSRRFLNVIREVNVKMVVIK